MYYYKNIAEEYIDSISTGLGQIEIAETEYNAILTIIRNAPTAPDGYIYKLRADNLEWELVELPPVPVDEDIDDSEALDIILGGANE